MSLNPKYYKYVCVKKSDASGITYEAYQPYGYPLVLRSKIDNRDLAAVYVTDLGSVETAPVAVKVPDASNRYQIIFGKDNTQAGFILTNLCEEGFLKFDIMRDDKVISEVDPGGINRVNEIRPFQSYCVMADYTNENRQIIISKSTDSDGKSVTLASDAKETKHKKTGDQLYLTITAKTGSESLANYFKETYWATPDIVVVMKGISGYLDKPVILKENLVVGGCISDDDDEPYSESDDEDLEYNAEESYSDKDKIIEKASKERVVKKRENIKILLNADMISNSHVANIKHGSVVYERYGTTGFEYRYDIPSQKCILGLSIIDGLCFEKPLEFSLGVASELLDEYIKFANYKLYDNIKTYDCETCVICMYDAPENIILRCGHKCTCASPECNKKLDKCPICRSAVLATINAKELMEALNKKKEIEEKLFGEDKKISDKSDTQKGEEFTI